MIMFCEYYWVKGHMKKLGLSMMRESAPTRKDGGVSAMEEIPMKGSR